MSQLNLFTTTGRVIEVVCIEPTKDMPIDVFRELYRFSMFSELMERPSENTVVWDEELETIWDPHIADVVYAGLQEDYFTCTLTVPKEWIE